MSVARVGPLARFGAALLLGGGIVLVVGPFASWASVRPDGAAFAAALHETPTQVRRGIRETTVSYTWLEGNGLAGIGLAAGVVVLVSGVAASRRPRRRAALVGAAAAVAAAGLAFAGRPDPAALLDTAIADAAKYAVAMGVDPQALRPVFAITVGRYTTYELVGAAMAVLGAAVLALAPIPDEGDPDWISWTRGGDG
ncbi:MAG: hypothetical protein ACM3OO_09750 [Planctomycetaceae bacterium]